MKELTVKAEVGCLDAVTDFVNGELESADCPMKTLMQIDLAVEELFVNIASYAYRDKPEGGDALIRIDVLDGHARITFEDGGIPFDPTAKGDPDRTASAEEREIGGLGIFLTKKIMDDVIYEYCGGRNVLTVTKKL
ncbi:MAG: ATP-binding protein [Ruminococcaceae bacterium]|nr:ATP-binding protein [Oscillospiraceae bacterium]